MLTILSEERQSFHRRYSSPATTATNARNLNIVLGEKHDTFINDFVVGYGYGYHHHEDPGSIATTLVHPFTIMKTSFETRPFSPPLPVEVLLQLLSHISSPDAGDDPTRNRHAKVYDKQKTLHAASLVNRSWHSASVEQLYRYPLLTSKNYDLFVRTICPSINLHVKKTDLANLVRVLDLRQLVFAGTKSFVARLLGRVKDGLEELKAPQTSFALNSLAALSKCQHLTTLDMSFVTESIPIANFFRTISKITSLKTLHLPRSSLLPPKDAYPPTSSGAATGLAWPPSLDSLIIPKNMVEILCNHGPQEPIQLDTLTVSAGPMTPQEAIVLSERFLDVRCLRIHGPVNSNVPSHFSPGYNNLILSYNNFKNLRSLEYHHMDYVGCLTYYLERSFFQQEDPQPLHALEELILGPWDANAASWTWQNGFGGSTAQEGEENGTIMTVLQKYEELFGRPPSLRRVFVYPDGMKKDAAEIDKLSKYLIDLELQRLKDGGAEYEPQECGAFMVENPDAEDPEDRKELAVPVSDLSAFFSADVVRTWQHGHVWSKTAESP